MSPDELSAHPTGTTPASPGTGQVATGTPTANEDEKVLAAVSYILTWITGLVIFLVAKKEQRYARWHAIQAIGIGIAAFVVGFAFNMLSIIFAMGGFAFAALMGMLAFVFTILVLVLIVLLAVKAYQGQPIRIPVLADLADKHA